MFKDSISKLVPNQLSSSQAELDYAKPQKLKARVKNKPFRQPLQDQTNKISSFKNSSTPVRVDIERCEDDSDSSQKEDDRNLQLDEKIVRMPEPILKAKQSKHLRKTFTIKEQPTEECIQEKDKQNEITKYHNQIQNENKPVIQPKKKLQKKQKTSRELSQIFQQRKLNIIRTASINKKIFTLDLHDSSGNEDEKEFEQNKINDFKYLNNVICRQNELKNIFQDKDDQNKEKSNSKNLLSSGSDHIIQKQKPPSKIKESGKRNKFILDSFDSGSDQQKKQGQVSEDGKRTSFVQSQYEEQLEVVRNMNVQKLKIHFQYVKIDNNFLVFSAIPPQCKTSLIVKRDTEKSQYFIFDSELVSQVIKVEKSIGGIYRFFLTKQNLNKDGKPETKQIAKMKSNFLGTEFHCYAYKEGDASKQKYQCISINYEVNILGLNGPRKVKVFAPQNPIPSDKNLMQIHEKAPKDNSMIKVYQSKTPKWMPELNAYVLNLRGTASHSSIKNCIIVDSQNENKEHLIFGKKSKDIFNLELKNPFTVLQGVAFAVSSFQRKLACE